MWVFCICRWLLSVGCVLYFVIFYDLIYLLSFVVGLLLCVDLVR